MPVPLGQGRAAAILALAALGVTACSPMRMTEDTPQSVSFRYDGVMATLSDVTAQANARCAAYGKVAHLRSDDMKAALERYAHFDCVSG